MKSDHRHELKTNELAEWLGNLPEWTKENLKTIIFVLVLITAVAAFYFWRTYTKNVVQVRERLEFSTLLNQLSASKMQVLNAQAQGRDLSFVLIQPANNLGNFAQNAKNDQMAALALIKQAEALRTELHYRPGTISEQDFVSQINQAKAAYTEAIETRLKATSNPSLTAVAEFGLGLCEEELGNFEKAKQIYQGIVNNTAFVGTVTVAQAKHRLDTMDDYKEKVIFKPAPAPPVASPLGGETDLSGLIQTAGAATKPPIQLQPVDTNLPSASSLPGGELLQTEAAGEANLPEINPKVPEPNVSVK